MGRSGSATAAWADGPAAVAVKTFEVTGGDKLEKALREIATRIGDGDVSVKVGFLSGATYPGTPEAPGLPVAQVAFWNEFGTTKQPPRPFFRSALAKGSPTWGERFGAALKATNYNTKAALGIMGEVIKGEVVQSIVDTNTPPLAASTIKRKGFAKPLIDTGVMQRSVDYVVESGT